MIKNSAGYRRGFRVRCEGPHRLTLNSQATAVTRLRLYESAIAFRFVFSRKIRKHATFDFCNTISHWRSRVLGGCAPFKDRSQSVLQAAREGGGRSPTSCGKLEFGGSCAKSSTGVFRDDEFLGSCPHRTTKYRCATIPSGRFFGFAHRRESRSDDKSTPGHRRPRRAGTDGRFSRFKGPAVL